MAMDNAGSDGGNRVTGEPQYLCGPMPPRAHAALYVVRMFSDRKCANDGLVPVELSNREQVIYDNALQCLNRWFIGADDLCDRPLTDKETNQPQG